MRDDAACRISVAVDEEEAQPVLISDRFLIRCAFCCALLAIDAGGRTIAANENPGNLLPILPVGSVRVMLHSDAPNQIADPEFCTFSLKFPRGLNDRADPQASA